VGDVSFWNKKNNRDVGRFTDGQFCLVEVADLGEWQQLALLNLGCKQVEVLGHGIHARRQAEIWSYRSREDGGAERRDE